MGAILDNGVVIDERFTAVNMTPGNSSMEVFDIPRSKGISFIHHWGNLGQKFDDVVHFLRTANSRQVSAHFVVEDGRVTCLVSPDDISWHAGNGQWNARSIGIECRPEMTQGDIDTLASLLRFIEANHGEQLIYIHKNVVNTECPGRYEFAIDEIVNKVNGGKGVVLATPGGDAVSCRCA